MKEVENRAVLDVVFEEYERADCPCFRKRSSGAGLSKRAKLRRHIIFLFYQRTGECPRGHVIDNVVKSVISKKKQYLSSLDHWYKNCKEESADCTAVPPKIPQIRTPYAKFDKQDFSIDLQSSVLKVHITRNRSFEIHLPQFVADRLRHYRKLGFSRVAEVQLSYRGGELYCSIVVAKELSVRTRRNVLAVDINSWGLMIAVLDGRTGKLLTLRPVLLRYINRVANIVYDIARIQRKYSDGKRMWYERRGVLEAVRRRYKRIRNITNDGSHKVAKLLVQLAEEWDANIAFEKLKGLKHGRGLSGRMQKVRFMCYRKIQEYAEYKAVERGIRVVYVDPRNTSKTDPCTGKKLKFVDKKKRWAVTSLGVLNRDVLASINIGMRAFPSLFDGREVGCRLSASAFSVRRNLPHMR